VLGGVDTARLSGGQGRLGVKHGEDGVKVPTDRIRASGARSPLALLAGKGAGRSRHLPPPPFGPRRPKPESYSVHGHRIVDPFVVKLHLHAVTRAVHPDTSDAEQPEATDRP